jgi:hypothetical protein
MYYVGFSSCTILASLILFQGFYDTSTPDTVSLFVGFIIIFLGVHLLEHSRTPEPLPVGHTALETGLMNPRLSIGGRASLDGWSPVSPGPGQVPLRSHARRSSRGSRGQVLFNAFEDELPPASASLGRLPEATDEDEDDDEDEATENTRLRGKHAPPAPPPGRLPRPSSGVGAPPIRRGNSYGR